MSEIAYFSTSAALADRLGDELIKDPQTAFFELIKNSYDADATEVRVRFHKTTKSNGTIAIQDDGSGMTVHDFIGKWLRVAGESKVVEQYSPKFKRRRLGAKGIGRFSAQKLGSHVKVTSRPPNKPKQLVFSVDFKEFHDQKNLDDIPVKYATGKPRRGFERGTIIEINELSFRWGKREIRKVRNELATLIDPEGADRDFRIILDCPEFPDLCGEIESPIAGLETHRVIFSIDRDGVYECDITIGEGSAPRSKEKREPLLCGSLRGVLRYYKEGLKKKDRQIADDDHESHIGVKVYRDRCRVRPYGEVGEDWLRIKARRAGGGGKYYVNYRSVAGSVYISATHNPQLVDASDRESGMLENDAFRAFHAFVTEHVDLLNKTLEQETRSEIQRQKQEKLKKVLDTVVNCLNDQDSDIYRKFIERIDREKKGELGQTSLKPNSKISDVKLPSKTEWHCRDCDARWRVLKNDKPTICMEFAVNRAGKARIVEGCGSTNIARSKHLMSGLEARLTGIVSGAYAVIGGKQIRVRIDPDMGENEEEYSWDSREIVINANHPAFKVAEALDRISGGKYEIGDDTLWPAQTMHVTKCVCLAWAELHYEETKRWDEYKNRYDDLQVTICNSFRVEIAV